MTDQMQQVTDSPATPASPSQTNPEQPQSATPYQPNPPGKRKFWTDDKIIDGLNQAGGNVSEACVILRQKYNHRIGRSTIYDAINAREAVRKVWFQAEGNLYDVCKFGVTKRAEAGNPRDQRLVYGKLDKKHGGDEPAQKLEIAGPDGQPLKHQHEVVADGGLTRAQIAALDDAELATLLAAERILYAKRCAIAAANAQA